MTLRLRQQSVNLSSYLVRTPKNRFKMIIVAQEYKNKEFFKRVYHELDESAIKQFLEVSVKVTDEDSKKIMQKAEFKDIKDFFEDTEVIRAVSAQVLQDTVEKRRPRPANLLARGKKEVKIGDTNIHIEMGIKSFSASTKSFSQMWLPDHADHKQILTTMSMLISPQKTFFVHGSPNSKEQCNSVLTNRGYNILRLEENPVIILSK